MCGSVSSLWTRGPGVLRWVCGLALLHLGLLWPLVHIAGSWPWLVSRASAQGTLVSRLTSPPKVSTGVEAGPSLP